MNLSTLRAAYLTAVLLISAIQTWADAVVAVVPTGKYPGAMAIDSVTNMIYVADFGDSNVTIINGLTNATSTVNVGGFSTAIAVNPVTDMIYVADTVSRTGLVNVINGNSNATTIFSKGVWYPGAIVVNTVTNMIYVDAGSTSPFPTIIAITGSTNATATYSPYPGYLPVGMVVNMDSNMLYVALQDSSLFYLNGSTNAANTISLGTGTGPMTIDPVNNTAYMATGNSLTTIGWTSRIWISTINAVASGPIAVNPVTNKIYVSNKNGTMTVIDGATNDTSTISGGGDFSEMAINSVTNKIYGINSGTVTVINGATNTISTVGNALWGEAVAVNSLTNMIYVANEGSNSVTVINGSLPFVPNIPSAPMLSSPSNGASNQPTTLSFSWNTVSGAVSYALQLSTVSSFSTTVTNQTGLTSGTSQAISFSQNKSYYWEVNATNSGGTSAWSTVWSFTTNNLPNVPVLVFPANGALNQPTALSFSWNTVSGAASYSMQLSTASTFLTTVTNQIGLTTGTSQVTSLSKNKSYYWKVKATNSAGSSAWSIIWSFTVTATSALPSDHFTLEPSFTINNGTVSYTLNQQGPVEFKIYDIIGRMLFQFNRVQPSGNYSFFIKRLNLPSGLYIVHFKAGNLERQATVMEK